jgi:hypothetical protein
MQSASSAFDVLPYLRVGGEGRVRYRLSGEASLPGGHAADVYLGPLCFVALEGVREGLLLGEPLPMFVGIETIATTVTK